MPSPRLAFALAGVVVLGAAGTAQAVVISESEVTRTVTCRPGDRVVRVTGAEAHLTVRGVCRSIVVDGAQARITARTVDRITIRGSESRVTYRRSSSGGRARVSVTGSGSRVVRRP